jgi:hypothetical protein
MREVVAVPLPTGEQPTNWVLPGHEAENGNIPQPSGDIKTNQGAGRTTKVDGVAATEEVE